MFNFDIQELQLIVFLCMDRAHSIGKDDAEKEGTADLYRKACAMLREYGDD